MLKLIYCKWAKGHFRGDRVVPGKAASTQPALRTEPEAVQRWVLCYTCREGRGRHGPHGVKEGSVRSKRRMRPL